MPVWKILMPFPPIALQPFFYVYFILMNIYRAPYHLLCGNYHPIQPGQTIESRIDEMRRENRPDRSVVLKNYPRRSFFDRIWYFSLQNANFGITEIVV